MVPKIKRTIFFVIGCILAAISGIIYDSNLLGVPWIVNTTFCVVFFGLGALCNVLAVELYLKSRG